MATLPNVDQLKRIVDSVNDATIKQLICECGAPLVLLNATLHKQNFYVLYGEDHLQDITAQVIYAEDLEGLFKFFLENGLRHNEPVLEKETERIERGSNEE